MGCRQLTYQKNNFLKVIHRENGQLQKKNALDYFSFGMPMPNRNVEGDYRYKFQGQEKDPETGGKEAFQLRLWDGRIGRWLTTDPKHAGVSPYWGMNNNPISVIDPDGGEGTDDYKLIEGKLVFWRENSVDRIFNADGTQQLGGDFNLGTFSDGMDFRLEDYLFDLTSFNTSDKFQELLLGISIIANKEIGAVFGDSKFLSFAYESSTQDSASRPVNMVRFNYDKSTGIFAYRTERFKIHTLFHSHPIGDAYPSWTDQMFSAETNLPGIILSGNGGKIDYFSMPGAKNYFEEGKIRGSSLYRREDNKGVHYKN